MSDEQPTFSCPHCRRQFKWSEDRAGRAVRCKCGGKFKVPRRTRPAPEAASASGQQSSRSRPSPPSSKPSESAGFDPFRELMEQSTPAPDAATSADAPTDDGAGLAAAKRCPACKRAVSANAVICINCGADIKTGKRKKTKVQSGAADNSPTPPQLNNTPGIPKDAGLTVAGIGLACHFFGVLLFPVAVIAAVILAAAGAVAAGVSAGPGMPIQAILSNMIALALVGIAGLLVVGGGLLCLAVPRAEARGLLITSIVLFTLVIPTVIVLGRSITPPNNFFAAGAAMVLMIGLAGMSILSFFNELADHIERGWLRQIAVLVMRALQVSVALTLGLLGLQWAMFDLDPTTQPPELVITLSQAGGILIWILNALVFIGYMLLTCALACVILFGRKASAPAGPGARMPG